MEEYESVALLKDGDQIVLVPVKIRMIVTLPPETAKRVRYIDNIAPIS